MSNNPYIGVHVIRIPHLSKIAVLLTAMLLITACGNDQETGPTPTPGPPTAAPGQMTVSDVIALAEPSWSNVESMRTTSHSGQAPREGEEVALTGSVHYWTPNGDRHLIEFENGSSTNEQIFTDGVIYMRGNFVSSAVAPELDNNTWVILDPSVVPSDSRVGVQIQYLTRGQENPYGNLTDDLLTRPVTESGTAIVGDRTCTVYSFGDENDTGTEIGYEIAVDAETGLPCQVIQRAGDFQNSTVYEYDLGITIEAPTDGTPVSGTPEG